MKTSENASIIIDNILSIDPALKHLVVCIV